jgi:DNA replication protein DnaC
MVTWVNPSSCGHSALFVDPTLADAILDRLIHNAYRLELQGESMRKVHSLLANDPN